MKQKFRSLPAAVQVAVTAVVVVVLAVVLTVWRHNGSTYLTGFWDNGSQTLVFGRMLQMQQNQTSPGGFMGVYTRTGVMNKTATGTRTTPPFPRRIFRLTPTRPGCRLGVRRAEQSALCF